MNSFHRPASVAAVAANIRSGGDAGHEVKDFLHEFQQSARFEALVEAPCRLEGELPDGRMLDAFLQALAVYLAVQVGCDPPGWTRPPIQLADPWFATTGLPMRNYLLLSSPAPFRTRNLFIDEDSLKVA